MSEPYAQACPRCVGALLGSRRRLSHAVDEAKSARDDLEQERKELATELRRAANADATHVHVMGRPTADQPCTLAWHAREVEYLQKTIALIVKSVRRWEREAVKEARNTQQAASALLDGCDLCGRAPLAKGRAA